MPEPYSDPAPEPTPKQTTDSLLETPTAVDVENMTLAEVIGYFWRDPAATWEALSQVVRTPPRTAAPATTLPPRPAPPISTPTLRQAVPMSGAEREARQREGVQLGLRLAAFLIAIYGNNILAAARVEQFGLNVGAPFLILAFCVWLAAEVYGAWPSFRQWLQKRAEAADADTADESAPIAQEWQPPASTTVQSRGLWERLALAAAGALFSGLAAAWTSGNRFTVEGVVAWFASIGLWALAFAPTGWGFRPAWAAIRQFRVRRTRTLYALVVIVLAGALFRLSDLPNLPPEMTSDHVEKLLDSQRVLDGNPQVFFPNNGGREPLQMYLMALLSRVPGLSMDFNTLKLLSALEGIVTIPIMWWFGREIIGRENRELGNVVGLALAALVAVSYWHVALSRLGLRIVLTPLIASVLIIFLARGMRNNRRGDFIASGLALGFGLYMYQAVRMLPLVVVAGVVLALLFQGRSAAAMKQYVFNLATLVVIALVVFVPLLNFSLQYPQYFWMRTSGRLFGDDVIQTRNDKGELIERRPTFQEQLEAFQKNLPVLMSNIRNALLMYNWKGDVAWISAAPNRPAMDVYTGSLLIVGLAAWLGLMFRRRDPVDWLMPLMLFIMIFPSALSIALPIENPSATRMSGTLPPAYLFAALPLALIALSLSRMVANRAGMIAGALAVVLIATGALNANTSAYFGEYRTYYVDSSPAPYTEAGRILRGFAESGGALGNAFLLAYPYWWDHRAVGIEAGVMDWPNGITDPDGDPNPQLPVDSVPRFLYEAAQRSDRYRFDPEKDILFFYKPDDAATEEALQALFPDGYTQVIQSYKREADFKVFRVPRMGTDRFVDFVLSHDLVGR